MSAIKSSSQTTRRETKTNEADEASSRLTQEAVVGLGSGKFE